MANWDRVKELTEESEKSAGTADEKYSAYTESIEASTKRIQNAWEEFTQTIKGSGIIKVLNDISAAALRLAPAFIKFALPFLVTARASKITNFVTASINKGKEIFGGGVKGLASGFVGKEITQDVTFDESGKPVLSQIETKKGLISSAIDKGAERVASAFNAGDLSNNVSSILKVLQDDRAKKAVSEKGGPTVVSKDGISFETYARLKPLLPEGEKDKNKEALGALRAKIYQEEYAKQVADYEKTQSVSGTSRVKTGRFKYQQLYRTTDQQQFAYDKSRKGYYYLDEKGGFGNLQVSDKMADQAKAVRNQQITNMAITGALTGVASGLMLAQQKSIAGKGTMGGNLASALTGGKMGEQQVEDPAASVSKGIVGGLGSALSVLPPPWNAIGPVVSVLGPVVVDFCSTMIHRSELEMKQRVQEAKENLQALDSVKSAVESGNSIVSQELATSDDYAKLKEYTDNLTDTLYDYTSKYGNDILKSINKGLDGSGVGDITTIADLCDKINNGNAKQRELIQKQIDIALAQKTLDETIKSQTEERDNLAKEKRSFGSFLINKVVPTDVDVSQYSKAQQELINAANEEQKFLKEQGVKTSTVDSAGYTTGLTADFSKYTSEELDALIKEAEGEGNEALDGLIERLKEAKKQIEKNEAAFAKLDKELVEQRVNVGVLSANIYNLTQTDLKDLTMDGVMGRVVKTMEAQGVVVRDNAGYIKKEYKTAIEQAIKADSKFNVLLENDTKTLGQLKAAQTKFNDYLKEHSDLVSKYGASWADWYSAIQRGEIVDETIQKIVYAANPERIEQFARAWNATAEELENLTNEFSDLTTALGLMTPNEVREYYSDLADIFTDLSDDTKITAENLEKIISKYPQLLKELSKEGKDAAELSPELINKINREQLIAYNNSLLNEELSSEGFFNDFAQEIKEKGAKDPKLLEYYNKYIGEVNNINELLDKTAQLRQSANNEDREAAEAIDELVKNYMDFDMEIQWENPLYTKAKQAVIDRYSKEIEQLQEQREALSQVNDERKRELDLIKAKDALENAKKEKIRVYRAGVGWTYEANEEAISQAQENLDNLDIQKRQEDIQYQIDQLEQIKNLIEGQDEEAQKKANEAALKSFFGDAPEKGLTGLFDSVIEGYKNNRVIINTATGKITDLEGNEIGKAGGLGKYGEGEDKGTGVLGGKQEAINTALSKIGDSKQKRWTSYEDSTNSGIMTRQEFKNHKAEAAKYNNSYQNYLDAMQAKYSPGEVSENGGSLINAKMAYEKLQKLNNQKADKYSAGYISAVKNYENAAKQLQSDIDEALAAGVSADNTTIKEASRYIDWDLISGIDYKIAEVKALGKEKPKGLEGTWTSKTNLNVILDPQANIYSDESLKDFKKHPTYSAYMKYDPSSEKWGNWEISSESSGSSLDTLKKLPAYSIVANGYGDDEYGYIDENEQIRELSYAKDGVTTDFGGRKASTRWDFAQGTESFQGGQALINELGTEAVITPSGTLTALPSKTGIVPADITKNVWALGEVAPTLVAQLNSLNQKPVAGNVGNTTYEEGQYFDHFTMNVYPAKGDDLDKILQQARAHVALTRHNN